MFCPVCLDSREAPRLAFFATTILLSLLPLAMIAVVVWWLRVRSRRSGMLQETQQVKSEG